MANKNTEYVFAYDISDNKERRKVERILKGYGFRRQFSVFICRLTRGDKGRLLKQLQDLTLKSGFVMMLRIASNSHVETIGTCSSPDLDSDYAFII